MEWLWSRGRKGGGADVWSGRVGGRVWLRIRQQERVWCDVIGGGSEYCVCLRLSGEVPCLYTLNHPLRMLVCMTLTVVLIILPFIQYTFFIVLFSL